MKIELIRMVYFFPTILSFEEPLSCDYAFTVWQKKFIHVYFF